MIIAKSPVRISFGGGGTDFPGYYVKHGGAVLCTTIDKYFTSILQDRGNDDGHSEIESFDYQLHHRFRTGSPIPPNDPLGIPKAVLNHFQVATPVQLTLKADVPSGSGLGLSGAVCASCIHLVASLLRRAMDAKALAELASHIEMDVLGRPIGMQDQYASAFGGLNFITFDDQGIRVEPVTPDPDVRQAFEDHVMLFFTGMARNSSWILSGQKLAIETGDNTVLDALHRIRDRAHQMREGLLAGNVAGVGELLHQSWQAKKDISRDISSGDIDRWYATAREHGALGGKITGAGGGGFLMLLADPGRHQDIRLALMHEGLQELPVRFEDKGAHLVLDQGETVRSTITPEGYLRGISTLVRKLDNALIGRIIDRLMAAYEAGSQVFILGNGGSASTASHFCGDLSKAVITQKGQRGFRTIPMTDNVPLMTAWGNDTGFENIFYGQLYNLLNADDVVIAISGGGMSPNVIRGVDLALERGATTIGFSGFSGGLLKQRCEVCLTVPSNNYQFVEDVHMVLVHLISAALTERLAAKG